MLKRAWHVSLAALLVALAVWAGGSAALPVQAAAVRIMPLGDSITGSPGCWRAILWTRLQSTGFTNIHFVGTQPPQGCGIPYDGANEGHGGALATNIVSLDELPGWLAATTPDIVMMHLGTNDVWGGQFSTAQVLAAYTTLIGQMRASNPSMKILVAQILPMAPSGCPTCGQRVVDLNQHIPAWASGLTTTQSPITVVDQWTGFDATADTVDGVHPNASGNQKMSDRWYPALSALLTPTGSPTPTPSGTATATPTPTPTASATPTPTPTASATPTPSPTPTSRPTPTPSAGSGPTLTPAVASSSPYFTEEDLKLSSSTALSALTVTIVVQRTAGVSFSGQYNTIGGQFLQSSASTSSAITYTFTLGTGQTLGAGAGGLFAAQASGSGTAHPTAGDAFTVTSTSGGVTTTQTGHF
jgi:lysophospholipase L1-like esterase